MTQITRPDSAQHDRIECAPAAGTNGGSQPKYHRVRRTLMGELVSACSYVAKLIPEDAQWADDLPWERLCHRQSCFITKARVRA